MTTWNPDAVQAVDPEEGARADAAMREYQRINTQCNADPDFNRDLQTFLRLYPQLRENTVRMYAGTPRLDGTRCSTAKQCAEAALGREIGEAEGEGNGHAEDQARKRGQHDEFKRAWAAYILACKERKERERIAKGIYDAEVAEARARYSSAVGPVPVAPVRPE